MRQVGSAFAFPCRLRLRSCRLMGAFVISPLPPFLIKTACEQGPLTPRALPRFSATTGPAATVSPSIAFPVLPVIRSTLLHRFLDGARTASPVARHVLATVLSLPPRRSDMPPRSVCAMSCCLRPTIEGSAFGLFFCRGHFWVHSRYGPVTRSPSQGWLCQLASSASFPPRMQPKLRGL